MVLEFVQDSDYNRGCVITIPILASRPISKKKSKSDSRQLTYFLNKKVRIIEEGSI